MGYACKIVADSISPQNIRLTTMEITFPRMVLAEFNTHRMLSRNASSSRAIPVDRLIKRIQEDPAGPVFWGKNQTGMVAEGELEGEPLSDAKRIWKTAGNEAINMAESLRAVGLHKQIANRIIEPWMYCTVIVTATEYMNFFSLRTAPDVMPEMRRIAEMMVEAYYYAPPPTPLVHGEWHVPYIQPNELFATTKDEIKVCTARCARVSLNNHDGTRDQEKDIGLHDRIWAAPHASPFEHPATPFDPEEWAVREELAKAVWDYNLPDITKRQIAASLMFNGNLKGWTQYRKTLPQENRLFFDEKPTLARLAGV